MAFVMDILFSMLFGAMLFMIVLSSNDIASEEQSLHSGDMIVQQMLTSTAQLLEGELRNMGFGVPENKPSIIYADSTRIAFLSVLDRSTSKIDTIAYLLGDTTELLNTQNCMDRLLYRKVNTEPKQSVGTVTALEFRYFTAIGELLPVPVPLGRRSEIYVVEVTMEVQNPYALYRPGAGPPGGQEALYSNSLWQQTRLASMNTRR